MGVDEVMWYVGRAGGLTAYALLTASVVLGLVLSLRFASSRWPRAVTNEVHRFTTLLALVFSGIHAVALVLDTRAGVGLVGAVVPFTSAFDPLGVGAGVVALELAIALAVSTRLRGRIGYARWRQLHRLGVAVVALALVHGLATGTDTGSWPVTALYLASLVLVGPLLIARILTGGAPRAAGGRGPRAAAPAGPGAAGPAARALPPLPPRVRPGGTGLPPPRSGRP